MAQKIFFPSKDKLKLCAIVDEGKSPARGSVVLAHGITVDKDEDGGSEAGVGAFVQLANALVGAHFNVLRFDFRGHGESEGSQEAVTITGELNDLTASMEYSKKRWNLPTAVVAASFGAVSTVMYAAGKRDIPCIVLWNPVLDLRVTFLEPKLPWAKQFFNSEGYDHLRNHGYLMLEGFHVGKRFVDEMRRTKPYEYIKRIKCPILTLHGDQDSYVPHDIAKKFSKPNRQSEFFDVAGSEHGFGRVADRSIVIPKSVGWIERFVGRKKRGCLL